MDKLTGGEYGFLLLTSNLGNPERKPLTVAQMRELFIRSEQMKRSDISRDIDVYDFVSIGYSPKTAQHMINLLHDEVLLQYYLNKARKADCVPITRATANYPVILQGCLPAYFLGELFILRVQISAANQRNHRGIKQ